MFINKIKRITKVSNGEEQKTIEIHYSEGNKDIVFHGYHEPVPEFHKLFDELSKHVCLICEFESSLEQVIRVTGVSISYTKSDDDDDVQNITFTARKRLVASPQPLIFNTPLKHSEHQDPGQKLSSDCFVTVEALTACAEEYVEGKREQLDAINDADEIAEAEAKAT